MQGVTGGRFKEIEMAKPELTKAGKEMSVTFSIFVLLVVLFLTLFLFLSI